MRIFETVHAEPRDAVESPRFRVNFWERPSPEGAWSLDAFVVADAQDVAEALQWAEEHARGRRFELFAEVDDEPEREFEDPRNPTLLRLMGTNPNIGETVEIRSTEEN